MSSNRYSSRLNGEADATRKQELIDRIERAISHLSVAELEALTYDMFTKGYLDL